MLQASYIMADIRNFKTNNFIINTIVVSENCMPPNFNGKEIEIYDESNCASSIFDRYKNLIQLINLCPINLMSLEQCFDISKELISMTPIFNKINENSDGNTIINNSTLDFIKEINKYSKKNIF